MGSRPCLGRLPSPPLESSEGEGCGEEAFLSACLVACARRGAGLRWKGDRSKKRIMVWTVYVQVPGLRLCKKKDEYVSCTTGNEFRKYRPPSQSPSAPPQSRPMVVPAHAANC